MKNMLYKKKILPYILLFMLSIFPIIDSINGYFLNLGQKSLLGVFYRFSLLIVIFLMLIKYYKKVNKLSIIFILLVTINILLSYLSMLISPENLKYSANLSVGIKLITVLSLVECLLFLFKNKILSLKQLMQSLNINTILLIVLFYVPLFLGYGFSVYADGSGYKSFYYSNNEFNAVLLMFFIYNTYIFFKFKRNAYLVNSILLLIANLLISSKSSLILCSFIIIYFLFISLFQKEKSISSMKNKYILIIMFIVIGYILVIIFQNQIFEFISRQKYLMKNSGGFLDYFTSSRTKLLSNSWNDFTHSNHFLLRFFLGNCGAGRPSEMDFFDLFFYFGITGFTLISVYFLAKIKNIIFKPHLNIMFLTIMFYSFFTGHLLFYGISGCYFAMFLSLVIFYDPKKNLNVVNILMIGNHPSVKGGISSVIDQLISHNWNKENIDVSFIATYIDKNNIMKILYFIYAYLHIMLYCISFQPNYVHIHMSYKGSFSRKFLITRSLHFLSIKYILHIHGSEFENFYLASNKKKQSKIRKILNDSSYVIALGQKWFEKLKCIAPNSNIIKIQNTVRIPNKQIDKNFKIFRFLFLGVLIKRKGVHDLLSAICKIKETHPTILTSVEFIIAGSGEEMGSLISYVNKNNLNEIVKFIGWIDQNDKEYYLSNCQCMILPSYNEGLPISILEAISYGLPIISTNVGDIEEAVVHNFNGYLFTPGDIDQLANYIIEMLISKNNWFSFSCNSRSIAKDKFDEKCYFEIFEKIYKEE